MEVMRAEIGKLRAELVKAPQPRSYASVAAGPQRAGPTLVQRVEMPKSRPALILSSADPRLKAKDVRDLWAKKVSFTDTNFAPARVTLVSNDKVRVEFDSPKHAEVAKRKVAKVPTLRAEDAKRLNPSIILKGIRKDSPSDALVGIIKGQNPAVRDALAKDGAAGVLRLAFLKGHRSPDTHYNAVLEVSPSVRTALLQGSEHRVCINHQRVRAEDFSPFMQCMKCLQFGHQSGRCPGNRLACAHCAEEGHTRADCPRKGEPLALRCYNCKKHNSGKGGSRNDAHGATHRTCPSVQTMMNRANARVYYGP